MADGEADVPQTCRMADAFLEAGFNCFDTARGQADLRPCRVDQTDTVAEKDGGFETASKPPSSMSGSALSRPDFPRRGCGSAAARGPGACFSGAGPAAAGGGRIPAAADPGGW